MAGRSKFPSSEEINGRKRNIEARKCKRVARSLFTRTQKLREYRHFLCIARRYRTDYETVRIRTLHARVSISNTVRSVGEAIPRCARFRSLPKNVPCTPQYIHKRDIWCVCYMCLRDFYLTEQKYHCVP